MLVFSNDKVRLARHFDSDRVLFAYHLGDLDDFYFPYCQWAVSYHQVRAKIDEVILTYTGGEIPSVIAFGLKENFNDLLEEQLDLLPDKFFAHFFESSRDVFKKKYKEKKLGTFYKMNLSVSDYSEKSENEKEEFNYMVLGNSHHKQLKTFYTLAYPQNYYTRRMLETKKYFAKVEKNEILAVTGIHVYSEKYKIAVLGNIATHPEFRNKGFAKKLASLLIKDLSKTVDLICLNVKADNQPAISCYEKLGFKKTHEYEESYFELDPSVSITIESETNKTKDDSLRNYGDRV